MGDKVNRMNFCLTDTAYFFENINLNVVFTKGYHNGNGQWQAFDHIV